MPARVVNVRALVLLNIPIEDVVMLDSPGRRSANEVSALRARNARSVFVSSQLAHGRARTSNQAGWYLRDTKSVDGKEWNGGGENETTGTG